MPGRSSSLPKRTEDGSQGDSSPPGVVHRLHTLPAPVRFCSLQVCPEILYHTYVITYCLRDSVALFDAEPFLKREPEDFLFLITHFSRYTLF